MHILENPALACAVQQHLHPELVRMLPGLWDLHEHNTQHGWSVPLPPGALHSQARNAAEWLQSKLVGPALAVPFLAASFCDAVVTEFRGYRYEPNHEEGAAFQIPEVVLAKACPTLYRTCYELFKGAMLPVLSGTFGLTPEVVRSIQLAKYTPDGTRSGNWHHDEDSDQTVVVSLAPELHTGGGTDLRHGFGRVHVPALDKGHALLFPGKTTLHRGSPVTTGERNLLVFWTELKND
jgi:hypothetical protein